VVRVHESFKTSGRKNSQPGEEKVAAREAKDSTFRRAGSAEEIERGRGVARLKTKKAD